MPTAWRFLGWAATAGTLAIYVYMLTVTLPQLAEFAGGVMVFDMRPGGYEHATAVSILDALGAEGARYYAEVQHRWDTAFPVLLGATVTFWTLVAVQRWRRHGLPIASWVPWVLVAVAVAASVADLGENMAVAAMLAGPPSAVTEAQSGLASTLTVTKSVLLTIALSALIVLAVGPWIAAAARRMRGRA